MATTRHPEDFDLMYGPDTRRVAKKFKSERTWKIAAAMGAIALSIGGLLAVTAGDFNRRYDPGPSEYSAPALVNPTSQSTDTTGSPDYNNPSMNAPSTTNEGTTNEGATNQGATNEGMTNEGTNNGVAPPSMTAPTPNSDIPEQTPSVVPPNSITDESAYPNDRTKDSERPYQGDPNGDRARPNGDQARPNDGTNPGSSGSELPADRPGTERLPPEGFAPRR